MPEIKPSDIRNFVIISHIDHGKSTLADRLLEITKTVEARRMRAQYLDQLDLERERGITIKMAPVRMQYQLENTNYVLNLIDTPGHSDFTYEVSRALQAVEGAILLIDATQGIQAQTLSNFRLAKKAGLTIIGAVNKIDLRPPHVEKMIASLAELIEVDEKEILRISGKTGEGIPELLQAVIERIPSPTVTSESKSQALIFDSLYDEHKGIVAYMRVFGGTYRAGDNVHFIASDTDCKLKEVGCFSPSLTSVSALTPGMIGYLATGLKEPALVKIGDTITIGDARGVALSGYRDPAPVVFIAFYPSGQTKFEDLYEAFMRLRLNDAALSFEPEANEALGRGLRVGFLGELHFEITSDRLSREFNLDFLTSFPSVAYRIRTPHEERVVKQADDWPENVIQVLQPMIRLEILAPSEYLSKVLSLKNVFEMDVVEMQNLGDNLLLICRMPLAELVRDFDDQLKSVSSGYASFSYELGDEAPAEVEKLEIMIAGRAEPALTRIVPKKDLDREARAAVDRLKKFLPAQQFSQALQSSSRGRIIARETIPAMKKNLGDFGKNGGDRTRKMKLWKKQKRGKERLKEMGRVNLPVEVFRELLKK